MSARALALLEEHNISATFFININFTNDYHVPVNETYFPFMSWQEIEHLIYREHSIGSHGISHRKLSELPADEVRYEMKKSKHMLDEKLGINCIHFAAPHGLINEQVTSCRVECGYKSIAATDYELTRLPFTGYIISRIPVFHGRCLKKQVPQLFSSHAAG